MACPVIKMNADKYRCGGMCCVCIRKSIQDKTSPQCLNFIDNRTTWVLSKIGLLKKPTKDRDMAHLRGAECPRQKANTGICPCKKGCPFISKSALCCMCVERYTQKGSLPKCLRHSLRSQIITTQEEEK